MVFMSTTSECIEKEVEKGVGEKVLERLEKPVEEKSGKKPVTSKQVKKKCKVCGVISMISTGTTKCPKCSNKLYEI